MPQCNDGIYLGGSGRGIEPEDDSHTDTDPEGQSNADGGYYGRDSRQVRDDVRNADPCQDTQQPATGGEHHRLHEELPDDLPLRGPDGSPDADLPSPLRNRGQHDVHDADPAHKKTDSGNGAEDDIKGAFGRFCLVEEGNRNADLIVFTFMEAF